MSGQRTWDMLLKDIKRACEDPAARIPVADAWATYIDQLQQQRAALLEALKECSGRLESAAWVFAGEGVARALQAARSAISKTESPEGGAARNADSVQGGEG